MIIPVKLIIAILWTKESNLDVTFQKIKELWGDIDFEGKSYNFDVTEYYENEMGKNLKRKIVSFKNLVSPDILVEGKIKCNTIEKELSEKGCRKVNLDIGYLEHNKVVLASVKYGGQKIYLDKGIYADMILKYGKGIYNPFDWTFMDFKDGRYNDELIKIREIYLNQKKKIK